MEKMRHYTNGFLTTVWNALIYSHSSISQKLESNQENTRWISIFPNTLDKLGIDAINPSENNDWRFKVFIYDIKNENVLDEYPLDVDLSSTLVSEHYSLTIEDVLLYLAKLKMNNSYFDLSWKIDAPY